MKKRQRKQLTVRQIRRNQIVWGCLIACLAMGCLFLAMKESLGYLVPALTFFVSSLLTFSMLEEKTW